MIGGGKVDRERGLVYATRFLVAVLALGIVLMASACTGDRTPATNSTVCGQLWRHSAQTHCDFDAAPDHSVAWYLPRGASPRVRLEVRDANGNVLGVLAETLTT